MDTTTPSNPAAIVSNEIVAALEAYTPDLLTPAQIRSGLADLRVLVTRCEPVSVADALVMMSSAARYLADVAPSDVLDVDRWIVEADITAWAHVKHREQMPLGTLSNHLQRLRRMLRVRRGLPARMSVRNVPTIERPPMTTTDRWTLELLMSSLGGSTAAAYVTGVGAGAVGTAAEDAMIVITGGVADVVMRDGTARRVVDALQPVANALADATVEEYSWSDVRGHASDLGILIDKEIAMSTHVVLALSEAADLVSIVRRHRITQKLIERAVPFLELPASEDIRTMLRG